MALCYFDLDVTVNGGDLSAHMATSPLASQPGMLIGEGVE